MIVCFIYACEFAYISCLMWFLGVVLFLVFVTSILWVPLFLIWGPSLLIFCYLMSQTKMGDFVIEYPIQLAEFVIYRYSWPRKCIWYYFYETIGWFSTNG